MATPTRRSGRTRVANTKYQSTSWDKETLRLLRADSESSNPTSVSSSSDGDPQPNNEFTPQPPRAVATLPQDEENNDSIMSDSSASASAGSHQNGRATISSTRTRIKKPRKGKGRVPKPSKPIPDNETHFRGLNMFERKIGKERFFQTTFGPSLEDIQTVSDARDRWCLKGRDVLFPSRASLEDLIEKTLRDTPTGQTNTDGQLDAFLAQLDRRQHLANMTSEDATAEGFVVRRPAQKAVIGPWQNEQVFHLPYLEPFNFGQAWKKEKQNHQSKPSSTSVGAPDSDDLISDKYSDTYHEGWLINVGERPQSLAWIPHQGPEQHLAISCRSSSTQRASRSQRDQNGPPAFTPSPEYPSTIQIWRFAPSNSKENQQSGLDATTPPRLVQTLCCEFGDVRQMTWMPGHAEVITDETLSSKTLGVLAIIATNGFAYLIRVPMPGAVESAYIRMHMPAMVFRPPLKSMYTTLAFASPCDLLLGTSHGMLHAYNTTALPGSLATNPSPYLMLQLHHTYILSLCPALDELSHYLSSTDASGNLALTDLRSPNVDRLTLHKARLPTKTLTYSPFTATFLTTMSSSTSTTIHTTQANPAAPVNANLATSTASSPTLISHSLRHFYTATHLAKYPDGSGTSTCIAASTHHPCVLTGTNSGTVFAQNILRRIIAPGGKAESGATKGGSWVVKVCEVDWRPLSATERTELKVAGEDGDRFVHNIHHSKGKEKAQDHSEEGTHNEDGEGNTAKFKIFHGPDANPGVIRFHEGFKAEKADLSSFTIGPDLADFDSNENGEHNTQNSRNTPVGGEMHSQVHQDQTDATTISSSTGPTSRSETSLAEGNRIVFDEERAVACMQWNPNVRCAGWIAIGWNGGVIRVQDLSCDVE